MLSRPVLQPRAMPPSLKGVFSVRLCPTHWSHVFTSEQQLGFARTFGSIHNTYRKTGALWLSYRVKSHYVITALCRFRFILYLNYTFKNLPQYNLQYILFLLKSLSLTIKKVSIGAHLLPLTHDKRSVSLLCCRTACKLGPLYLSFVMLTLNCNYSTVKMVKKSTTIFPMWPSHTTLIYSVKKKRLY